MDNKFSPDPNNWSFTRWATWVKWQPNSRQLINQRWEARPEDRDKITTRFSR